MKKKEKPKLIILSGPSGVGKSTLVRFAVEKLGLNYFQKVTTRKKRPSDNEQEKEFISKKKFKSLKRESNIIFDYELRGNKYGFRKSVFLHFLKSKKIFICDIGNIEYIKNIKEKFSNVIAVYITGNCGEIIQRIKQRKENFIQKRRSIWSVPKHLKSYKKNKKLFEFEINNVNLALAKEKLINIIKQV